MYRKERLNKRPVFILGFSRGGTNILLNFLLSHPDLCGPGGEFHQVLRRKLGDDWLTFTRKSLEYLSVWLMERQDVLSARNWQRRTQLTFYTQRQIDRALYFGKIKARKPGQNLFKSEGVPYAEAEIKQSRLLCKVPDGNILLSEELLRIYPDATFIGLVRNGFAVAEGHIRRGAEVEQIAEKYDKGCQWMIENSRTIPNFHLLRYEDCVAEPVNTLFSALELIGADSAVIKKVRLETKQVINKTGEHEYVRSADGKKVIWYAPDEIAKHFRKDANENQIARLTSEQKKIILRIAKRSLKYFNYI